MEELLARAQKVTQQAEVFYVSSEETPVQFESNRLKHIQSKQTHSLALRLIKNGRTGYAVTTEAGNGQELVEMALETARFGQSTAFDFPSPAGYPPVEIYDPAATAVPLEAMVKLGEELIALIRKASTDIVCEANVTKAVLSVSVINSQGGRAEYKKSIFALSIEGSLIRGTDMLFVGDGISSCRPVLRVEEVGQTVLKQLERARNQASAPSKTLPVIFTPHGVASALIPGLAVAFNGKVVLEGASPIGDKLGNRVFDDKIHLADDATLAYRPASRPFDDEAVTSRRTPLIEAGRVSGFLYDLKTAAQARTESTGNGGRGGGLPSPSPSAFIIAPGETAFEDMVADIKEGLIIEYLMGASQGNILGGDFSGNVLLGYKIESGKIVGRVKDTMVSGNIYQALKKVAAIGSDTRWVGGSLKTPSIYCSGLSVASK